MNIPKDISDRIERIKIMLRAEGILLCDMDGPECSAWKKKMRDSCLGCPSELGRKKAELLIQMALRKPALVSADQEFAWEHNQRLESIILRAKTLEEIEDAFSLGGP